MGEIKMINPWVGRSVTLVGDDPEQKRAQLRDYFHRTFDIYEALFRLLVSDEAFYQRPEKLRHPLIFYFGHTACFFINKLVLAKACDRVNPRFESMFAIGVDEMSWDDLDENHYDWPTVDQVRAYRDQVRARVDTVICDLDLRLPVRWQDHPAWTLFMGIEHERIHLETSSVLMRQLDLRWLRGNEHWPLCRERGEPPENALLPVPAGGVALGRPADSPLYGWDNEYGSHQAEVAGFQASRYLVSNREFLAFVEDGGYQHQEHWTEEGRGWLSYSRARHPLFWVADGSGYRFRTLAEEIDMPWNWPVEVNCLEAKAFCNWKAAKTGQPLRLPSEDEWYRLRDHVGVEDEPDWPRPVPWNINLEHAASSVPIDRFCRAGFGDVIGNVWQWTETPIYGFEGFEVHPLYDDFSTPTFDNRHNLIKGGSWISSGNEATRDARYAFRRHFFQHAGFRYVAAAPLSEPEEIAEEQGYETDGAVAQYCEFHYGDEYFGVPNFPRALVRLALSRHQGGRGSALDIGCAVGRASFELAQHFDQVTGVDFSARFIRQAIGLQETCQLAWEICREGELSDARRVTLEQFGYQGLERKLSFWQGDACNLKPRFSGYDLVLAANLIDRLYDPAKFLRDLAQRILPGGTLVLASPYTWMEQYTERRHWLGGGLRDGEAETALEAIGVLLREHFEPLREPCDLPFVIRETGRKFQHSLSQVSFWRRR
jgi:5-histidylcysteine sulfoxide synthase/putative 4-mercaptohistidine N1-methyltranferase